MRVQVFQHVPFEGLGSIEPWLTARGAEIRWTRLHAGALPPDMEEVDFLIVLGGPMGIYDEADHPWLVAEKAALKKALDRDTPVLGICLGAQLIADALGAKVTRNEHEEIGWFPVEGAEGGELFPKSFTAFHWHGDTFGIPEGAKLLASSTACRNQAFAYGDKVVGLQFHLETTAESAGLLVENCGVNESTWVQSADAILSAPEENYRAANEVMALVLEWLTPAPPASP